MSNLPCVDCITLPICKGFSKQIESETVYHIKECPTWEPHDTLSFIDSNLIIPLYHKCSIIEEWLKRPKREYEQYTAMAIMDIISPKKMLGLMKYMNSFLFELYVCDKKTVDGIFELIKRTDYERETALR